MAELRGEWDEIMEEEDQQKDHINGLKKEMTDSLADIKEKLKDNEEIQQLDLTKINAEINKDKAGEESEQAVHKMDHYFSDF